MKKISLFFFLFSILFCSISDHKRQELNHKLEEKISKFRNLELVNGEFQALQHENEDQQSIFDRIEKFAHPEKSSFANDPDDQIRNNSVDDIPLMDLSVQEYQNKINPFNDTIQFEGESFQFPEDQPENITIELSEDVIKKNITDFHLSIFNCLDTHSRSDNFDQNSFLEISEDCIGHKRKRLIVFYNDISFQIKELFFNLVSKKLVNGICKQDFVLCMEYYRGLQLAAELGMNVEQTIKSNAEAMAVQIGDAKMNFFFKITKPDMEVHQNLRDFLDDEKAKINGIIKGKLEDFENFSKFKPKVSNANKEIESVENDEFDDAIELAKEHPNKDHESENEHVDDHHAKDHSKKDHHGEDDHGQNDHGQNHHNEDHHDHDHHSSDHDSHNKNESENADYSSNKQSTTRYEDYKSHTYSKTHAEVKARNQNRVKKSTAYKPDLFSSLPVNDKTGGKGKAPVFFPVNSQELDKIHSQAHALMKFRLNEQAQLRQTHIFFKK